MIDKEIRNLDLVILGAGPAGLTAGIYASRARLNMILLENAFPGGQVRNTFTVENYPGFKSITGAELADKMQEHAEYSGVEIDEFDPVVNISLTAEEKIIETESYIYKPKAVILATGSVPKKLPVKNEEKFAGKGVHYCAVCDGAMYTDKVVAVVGGGNAALEEAIYLSRFAKKVYSLRRADSFKGEKTLFEEASKNEKIEILYNTDITSFEGNDFLEKIILKDVVTGETRELNVEGVFGSIGTEPKTTDIAKYINVNEYGYILTNELMETNVPGVFAAGDVREKPYRQITTAVADGTVAALAAERYIK